MSEQVECAVEVESARPILKLALWLTAIISAMCVGGGIVAILWNSVSPTQIDILGMTVTTGHVGVALVGFGTIALIITVRSIVKIVYRLAALPAGR